MADPFTLLGAVGLIVILGIGVMLWFKRDFEKTYQRRQLGMRTNYSRSGAVRLRPYQTLTGRHYVLEVRAFIDHLEDYRWIPADLSDLEYLNATGVIIPGPSRECSVTGARHDSILRR